MKVSWQPHGFPTVPIFAFALSGAFVAAGIHGLVTNGSGSIMDWLRVGLGVSLIISWSSILVNRVVRITVDDEGISILRMTGEGTMIKHNAIIYSEFGKNTIRFSYKGPLDVESVTLPLRSLCSEDTDILRDFFRRPNAEQIAVADRHQHHSFPPTTPQSPGG